MKLIQLLVILLLISFILFIMFQVENVEGFNMKNIEGMTDPDLPPCPSYNDASGSSCGSVNQDEFLDDFNKLKEENYILKTKIVTPVCPNDPYDDPHSDWKKEHEELHRQEREREKREREERERERERVEREWNNRPFLPNLNMDLSSNRLPAQNTNSSSEPSNLPQMPNFFNSNTMLNQNTLSTPEKRVEPEPAKAEDKKSTPEDLSKCPPCPACERCPEPTVDCKKVVNYKSKSYPVPLIADFSTFSRFG